MKDTLDILIKDNYQSGSLRVHTTLEQDRLMFATQRDTVTLSVDDAIKLAKRILEWADYR